MKLKFNPTDWELPADESEMGFYVEVEGSNLDSQTVKNDTEVDGELSVLLTMDHFNTDSMTQMDLNSLPVKLKISDNKVEGIVNVNYLKSKDKSDLESVSYDEDCIDYDTICEIFGEMYEGVADDTLYRSLNKNLSKIFTIKE
jgi:hypothetical protein